MDAASRPVANPSSDVAGSEPHLHVVPDPAAAEPRFGGDGLEAAAGVRDVEETTTAQPEVDDAIHAEPLEELAIEATSPGTSELESEDSETADAAGEAMAERSTLESILEEALLADARSPLAETEDAPEPTPSLDAIVAETVAAAPSLTSTDPQDRRRALEALATHDMTESDTHRVEAMLLDPEAEVRTLALQALVRRPDRVSSGAVWQALQDPTDEVRALAVELAAERGDAAQIAPLLSARDWPRTQEAVLHGLPEILATTPVDDRVLGKVLGAVGDLDPAPLPEEEPAIRQLALAIGSRRILGALSWPDVPRLGALRLLSHDRSPDILRELAVYDADPIEEIRELAFAARTELAMADAVREPLRTADGSADEEEAERIASLARALVDADPTVRHLALSGLAGMDRTAIATWTRDAIGTGEASQLSLAATTAQMLRLVEGAADILDAAAELPLDARHSLLDALTSFVMPPDQLAGLLPLVREENQAEAIRMLWQVGGPPLLPHLRSHLDDPSIAVRQAVLDVFAESGDGAALDVARACLESDVSPIVRARAVRMLSQLTVAPPTGTIVLALSDPDPEVRATAIETLPDVNGAEAVDALTSSLRDQDDRVRLAAAKRLAAQAIDPELVWSSLRSAPEAGRGDIISSFERVRSGSLTQIALERLRSSDLEERILAIEVCGWGTSPGCVEGAIQALHDPSAVVRRTATVALGRLKDPAAAAALGKALGDPDAEVRMGVIRALGVIDDEAVLGFLVSALNDPVEEVRDVTSQVLTEWSSPAVARRLAGVLAVPRLREAATELLTRIGTPAVELLIDVLMQHNPAVVPTIGELLRGISTPEDFLARLDAIEPERRLRGLEALGAIGGPEAADALLRSVADPDERIRARSAQLLAELGDPKARDALTGLLRDPLPGVQAAAQDALARLPD
jgi:HEAT repeat protein